MKSIFGLSVAVAAIVTGVSFTTLGQAQAAETVKATKKSYSTVLFGGADTRKSSHYGYVGAIHAFNGNLAYDGFLARVFGLYSDYRYRSAAVAGGRVNADAWSFDAMLGYQKYFHPVFARLYVGLEVEDHKLTPNNRFDSNRGSDLGVKVQGEIESYYSAPVHGSLIASFGSAKERYWVRGRLGPNLNGSVLLGPEFIVTGDQEYDEQRVGGFIVLREFGLGATQISISGGYSDGARNRGGDSAYGSVELSTAF